MIAEASKEQYRGVLCIHCRQAIPLSASQVRKEKELRESEPNEMTELRSSSFNLRCRACHGEATYTAADTIDCDGRTSSAQHVGAAQSPAAARAEEFVASCKRLERVAQLSSDRQTLPSQSGNHCTVTVTVAVVRPN